jgi:hypothetical protein
MKTTESSVKVAGHVAAHIRRDDAYHAPARSDAAALAGAVAGLASGAAAAVYCLHCPEMSAAFVGFWYLLGMLVPTVAGALLGPRVLAW